MRTAWEPDPEKAPKVLAAFEMYASGASLVVIVQATKVVAAKNGLSTLLRNRAYLGERIYNQTRRASLQDPKYRRLRNDADDFVIKAGDHEAIVPEELFYRVQSILDSRRPKLGQRKNGNRNAYVLSGLLWCKEHSVPYTGHTTGTILYYACGTRKKLGKKNAACAWLRKDAVESFVLDTLKSKIFTPRLVREGLQCLYEENAKARQQDDSDLWQTQAKMAEIELKVSRLIQAIAAGIDASSVEPAIKALNQESASLKIHVAELEKERSRALRIPPITDVEVADVLGRLHTMLEATDPRELKAVLAHFIERIDITGTQATIAYTFGEPKTELVPTTGDPEGI
jgi:site-specific DNA recombinase